MKLFTFRISRILFVFIGLAFHVHSNAQKTWDGSSSNNWNTAANWTPSGVPGSGDDVIININATINVNTNPTIRSLTISGNATVSFTVTGTQTITIANNGSSITSGSTLTLTGISGGGTRQMIIAFSGAGRTMSIAGTLNVNIAGNDPGVYTATNSLTTVTGIINNNGGTINSTAANLSFSAGSTYNHQTDGNGIPVATWAATSNCNITGIINTGFTGINQSFGNLTWNCVGQTGGFDFVNLLTSVQGNLTISNTNTFGLLMATSNNNNYTLNIGGNLTINDNAWFGIVNGDNIEATVNVGGNFTMSGASAGTTFFDYYIPTSGTSTMRKITMNVAGNVSQSGGFFDFCYGNSDAANFPELIIGGNFSFTGGVMQRTSGDGDITNGRITFNKSGTQTVFATTPANLAYTNFVVASTSTTQLLSNIVLYENPTANFAGNFTVDGILDAGTNQILSSSVAVTGTNNAFTLSSGAGLITANVNGVQNTTIGTISTSLATRTFSSAANYTYNGTAIQNSGTFVTTPTANEVNNLTLNNTAGNTTTGVTLQQPIAVAGVLTLTSGHITTDATNILTMNAGSNVAGQNYGTRVPGSTDNSFVNGPMSKVGTTAFLFPVGKLNRGGHFCGISAPSPSTTFTAEYIRNTAHSQGAITASGLLQISNCEFWTINRTGSSAVDVTLSWNGNSNCNAAAYVNTLASLTIAHNNGTSWNTHGGSTDAGSAAPQGSITWTGVNTFSPFTIGSTSAATNPLPVTLVNVKAYRNGSSNKIEWTNLTESDVAVYEVQRSVNGTAFVTMSSFEARSNASSREDYAAVDFQNSPVTYYRIKVTGIDGKVVYSPVVKVAGSNQLQADMVVYPNPVTGKQVTLQLNAVAGNYSLRVFGANGQLVKTETIIHPGGSYSKTIELPGQLPAGHYYLQVTGGEQVLNSKLIIQ